MAARCSCGGVGAQLLGFLFHSHSRAAALRHCDADVISLLRLSAAFVIAQPTLSYRRSDCGISFGSSHCRSQFRCFSAKKTFICICSDITANINANMWECMCMFVCECNRLSFCLPTQCCCHLCQIRTAGLERHCNAVGGGVCSERLTTCIRFFCGNSPFRPTGLISNFHCSLLRLLFWRISYLLLKSRFIWIICIGSA